MELTELILILNFSLFSIHYSFCYYRQLPKATGQELRAIFPSALFPAFSSTRNVQHATRNPHHRSTLYVLRFLLQRSCQINHQIGKKVYLSRAVRGEGFDR